MITGRNKSPERLRRYPWLNAAGIALVAVIMIVALRRPARHQVPAPAAIDPAIAGEPAMRAIKQLISAGDLAGATTRLGAAYRFDRRHGLAALQQFAIYVLQRGLNEQDPFERYFAASALARGGSDEGVDLLVRGVQSNPDLSLKMAAADGLGDVGNAYAVGVLQKLYYTVNDFDRRIVANAIADTTNPTASVVLTDAAGRGDQTLRLAGLQGLGKLGDRTGVPLLNRVLNSADAPIERAMAAASLLRLGETVDLGVVQSVLADHRDGNARAIAAMALGYARDPRMVPVLQQALADDNSDVRIGAAAALTHYRQPAGVDYLKTAMTDTSDPLNRQHVAQVLDQVAFDGGYQVLIAAVGSTDPNLQMAGVRALGLSGGTKEVELLEVMLPHVADPLMRAQIAWALGRISQPSGIVTLIGLVQEQDPAVRDTAADALDRTAQRLVINTPS